MIDQLAWVAIPLPQGVQGVEALTFSFRSSEGSRISAEAGGSASNKRRAYGLSSVYTADSI